MKSLRWIMQFDQIFQAGHQLQKVHYHQGLILPPPSRLPFSRKSELTAKQDWLLESKVPEIAFFLMTEGHAITLILSVSILLDNYHSTFFVLTAFWVTLQCDSMHWLGWTVCNSDNWVRGTLHPWWPMLHHWKTTIKLFWPRCKSWHFSLHRQWYFFFCHPNRHQIK